MLPPESLTTELLLKTVSRADEQAVKQILTSMKHHNLKWAEMRHKRTGDTALHVAVRSSSLPIVKMLAEFCHEEDEERKNCDMCNRLLEITNNLGKRCLHEAAQICHVTIVEYLIQQGVTVDALKSGDWTPLMLACCKSGVAATETSKILLEHEANPLLKNKDGWTALHQASRAGWVDTVRLLLKSNSAAVTYVSCNGRTPLHIASLHGHTSVVEELLKAKSPVDPIDACGLTPLHEAVRGGHIPVIRILEDHGANVYKIDSMGLSCLHFAAATGRPNVIQYFMVEYCMFVDEPSGTDKLTALHCAVRAGQVDSVKTLLSFGANPAKQDKKGRTAYDFCSGFGCEEIEALLNARNGGV